LSGFLLSNSIIYERPLSSISPNLRLFPKGDNLVLVFEFYYYVSIFSLLIGGNIMMEPVILASGSLRRQDYFRLLGLPFSIMPPLADESPGGITDPRELAEALAVRKVNKIISLLKGRNPPWICGADTVISVKGEIFGKPVNREEAREMLLRLQGRTHEVITAVALFNGKKKAVDCRSVLSAVSFVPLSEEELEWYLDTGEWQGVAGGYKIQGLGGCLVSRIEGSYSAIVGLPLHEFYAMLRDNGYPYGAAEISAAPFAGGET
jgi:septum formation protein